MVPNKNYVGEKKNNRAYYNRGSTWPNGLRLMKREQEKDYGCNPKHTC